MQGTSEPHLMREGSLLTLTIEQYLIFRPFLGLDLEESSLYYFTSRK
jgi:hypothetical protein